MNKINSILEMIRSGSKVDPTYNFPFDTNILECGTKILKRDWKWVANFPYAMKNEAGTIDTSGVSDTD